MTSKGAEPSSTLPRNQGLPPLSTFCLHISRRRRNKHRYFQCKSLDQIVNADEHDNKAPDCEHRSAHGSVAQTLYYETLSRLGSTAGRAEMTHCTSMDLSNRFIRPPSIGMVLGQPKTEGTHRAPPVSKLMSPSAYRRGILAGERQATRPRPFPSARMRLERNSRKLERRGEAARRV